jgi:hypothetical protein
MLHQASPSPTNRITEKLLVLVGFGGRQAALDQRQIALGKGRAEA